MKALGERRAGGERESVLHPWPLSIEAMRETEEVGNREGFHGLSETGLIGRKGESGDREFGRGIANEGKVNGRELRQNKLS